MSRRRAAPKRKKLPDPKFHSELITKFINHIMLDGKKSVAEKIVYDALAEAFKRLANKLKEDGINTSDDGSSGEGSGGAVLVMFQKALDTLSPSVEVRSRRVGGATYQVPVEVKTDRRITLAMRWLINAARARSEKTMALRVARELEDIYQGRGNAMKKKDDTHRMAMANQAFAHYQW